MARTDSAAVSWILNDMAAIVNEKTSEMQWSVQHGGATGRALMLVVFHRGGARQTLGANTAAAGAPRGLEGRLHESDETPCAGII